MNKTRIDWCDYTWNIITGCTHGCPYCYARKIAERFRGTKSFPNGFDVTWHPERLEEPAKKKKPSRIFCCSMSDFWGNTIKDVWRFNILKTILLAQQHQFLILTKTPQNMDWIGMGIEEPQNLWQGVSVTGPEDLWRIDELVKRVPARRVVSFEPLLGKLGESHVIDIRCPTLRNVNWIIVGQQTNPSIVVDGTSLLGLKWFCIDHNIPLFMKNNIVPPYTGLNFDYEPKIQQYPKGW